MDVKASLERWTEAGLISPDQVSAITNFEEGEAGPAPISRAVEALAYLGATLVLVALGMLGQEVWDRIEAWGQLAVALIITAVLFGVGMILGRSEEAAIRRAQTFAWLLTVGGVALSAGALVFGVLELKGDDARLIISLAALAGAVALWLRRRSSLQMVAVGGTTLISTIMALSLFDSFPNWAFGLSLAGLGIIWLLLTWGGVFTPVRTSYALGGIGVLFIAFPEATEAMPWPLLGLLAALALLGLSVRVDQQVLMGLGVVGLFIYVPMTVFEWFGDSLSTMVVLLITGLLLLGAVVGVVRLRRS